MSELNRFLVPLKAQLEEAEAELSEREWGTLRAILIIALTANELRAEEEVA